MVTSLVAISILGQGGLTLVPSGMTAKMGGYMPIRAEMAGEAGAVKKAPTGLSAPMYGTLKLGDKAYAFILDEPEGKNAALYVDSNANGDLTDDPAAAWAPRKQGNATMYFGSAKIDLGGKQATVNLYRFDKTDPQRAALKNTVLYYGDFGYEGKVKIGPTAYPVAVGGPLASGVRVWIDRNGNGKNDGRSESVAAGQPFNFGGTTYELRPAGGTLQAVVSEKTVAEIPLPPDLSVGRIAPSFKASATDGTTISFPESYKGKIVMLDFWATWCGPCIAELPNVIKAYEKYHDQGLEILGISFDQENMAEKLATFTKERNMPWKQIYEGKFWNTSLGTQYGVEAIPFVLLVEGGTGKILATVSDLRGEKLEQTLESVLAKRK